YVRWVPFDGVGRSVRNGLNFTERGFGIRALLGCSDPGHTAISQMKPGEVDWNQIFSKDGAQWFHTAGIFCALSENASLVAQDDVRLFRFEVCRRIVESDVPILTNTEKGDVDWLRSQVFANTAHGLGRICSITFEQVIPGDAGLPDQLLQQHLTKAPGMRDRQPDVL